MDCTSDDGENWCTIVSPGEAACYVKKTPEEFVNDYPKISECLLQSLHKFIKEAYE